MENDAGRPKHHEDLLMQHLRNFLGEVEPGAAELLRDHLEWVDTGAGETLMVQGEPGDAMYLLVSGRLRTYIAGEDGTQRMVREISRGQIVGEMSLYTDQPRSATLVAIRDSVLVRLGKADFNRLLVMSAQVSIALTRQIIHRLQTEVPRSPPDRPVTMGLLPVSDGVDLAGFAERLAAPMRSHGRVAVVDAARLDAELEAPGITARPQTDTDANRRISMRLDEIEAAHDFVLLLGDAAPSAWTQRCSRHSDELLLLANADCPPVLHATEQQCLMHRPQRTGAADILVLLHPADRVSPRGSAAWLARRPLADHVHVRPTLDRDMARLARLQSRTAVGLVLAGGGARGLAHLGAYRAMRERGIEVDVVGGTSIGAVMAVLVASDRPLETVTAIARKAFVQNPTGDFNLLPLVSLIKGRRLHRVVEQATREIMGFDADLEDLWKGFYCVATNYSQASEFVMRRGPLLQAVLASVAIPGALPPRVHGGDLLCDGGTFNNFPVDVMRQARGVGRVIGVDPGFHQRRHMAFDEVPGTWALLRDRLRPRAKRRYRLPSLPAYLMNVIVLYSTSRRRQARALTDLYINLPLLRVGMLEWQRFDEIVEQGYRHAREQLDADAPPATAATP